MPRRVYDEQYNNDKELKKGHTYISLKKRLKLIQLVFKEKMTIYKAAKRLKICHPTAKFIIKSYRKGRIYEYEGEVLQIPIQCNQQAIPQGSSPEIQKQEVVATPPLENITQISESSPHPNVCLAHLWATLNNHFYVMPFYYYQ